MGDYTVGFQGSIEYVDEASYGAGCPDNPTMLAVSDYVQSVRINADPGIIKLRDFDSYDVQEIIEGLNKYGFTVEYLVQNSTLITDCITRTNGDLDSLYFDIGLNTSGTATYYACSGCKCKSLDLSVANEEAITATAEFSVKSVTTTTSACDVGSGSHATATTIATDVYTFSGCDIERPDGTDLAYIIDRFSMTINNNIDERCTIGSSEIKLALPGQRDISGSADVSVADGGKTHWDEVMACTENNLVWEFGAAGAPKITVTNVTWDTIELEGNISDSIVIPSVPWSGQGITVGVVT